MIEATVYSILLVTLDRTGSVLNPASRDATVLWSRHRSYFHLPWGCITNTVSNWPLNVTRKEVRLLKEHTDLAVTFYHLYLWRVPCSNIGYHGRIFSSFFSIYVSTPYLGIGAGYSSWILTCLLFDHLSGPLCSVWWGQLNDTVKTINWIWGNWIRDNIITYYNE
jgi:hypothetical protein